MELISGSSEKLWGEGSAVKIDESIFSRWKYIHVRLGVWLCGAWVLEELSIPVPIHSASTLLQIIMTWMKPGTIIISDYWVAFVPLGDERYTHHTVNHIAFVDSWTSVHKYNNSYV